MSKFLRVCVYNSIFSSAIHLFYTASAITLISTFIHFMFLLYIYSVAVIEKCGMFSCACLRQMCKWSHSISHFKRNYHNDCTSCLFFFHLFIFWPAENFRHSEIYKWKINKQPRHRWTSKALGMRWPALFQILSISRYSFTFHDKNVDDHRLVIVVYE